MLVEDDTDIAASLGEYLGHHGVEVDYAYTAAQARALVATTGFSLLVLDVNLPGENGLALCRELKLGRNLAAPVLFLTARGSLEDKLEGFAAGAVDWIVKPFAPAELLARIRALASHHAGQSAGERVSVGDYVLDVGGAVLHYRGLALPLHANAATILRLLLSTAPAVVPRQVLIAAIWGDDEPDSDPLRAHVWQLRRSLLDAFGTRPIVTERGLGWRFEANA